MCNSGNSVQQCTIMATLLQIYLDVLFETKIKPCGYVAFLQIWIGVLSEIKIKLCDYMAFLQIWMDVSLKGTPLGRVEIVLFSDRSPLASENLRRLATGNVQWSTAFAFDNLRRLATGYDMVSGQLLLVSGILRQRATIYTLPFYSECCKR